MTYTDAAKTAAGPAPRKEPQGGTLTPENPEPETRFESERAALSRLLSDRPPGGGTFEPGWHGAYLDGVARLMRSLLGSATYADPLHDIARQLVLAAETRPGAAGDTRELAFIHAYAAAEISYLILTGADEAAAAQRIARQLVTDGVALPRDGDDPRGWMRLLKWRDALRSRRQPVDLFDCYQARIEVLKAGRR